MQLSPNGLILIRVDSSDIAVDGSFIIPESVNTIGDGAFYNCLALKKLIISDKIKQIGISAFENCKNLEFLKIYASITEICAKTFAHCEKLRILVLPSSVTKIRSEAFRNCQDLWCLILPDGPLYIEYSAFAECINLRALVLPANAPTIHRYSSARSSIIHTEGNIGQYMFGECRRLETLIIPDGTEEIGNAVFNNCENLHTLVIPESIKEISIHPRYCTDDGVEGWDSVRNIIIVSQDVEAIARITSLFPPTLQTKITNIDVNLGQEASRIRKAQMARVLNAPQTSPLFRFFTSEKLDTEKPNKIQREREMIKMYGYLSPEILVYINNFLADENQFARKARIMMHIIPLPTNKAQLVAYEEKITAIANLCIEKATIDKANELVQSKQEEVESHTRCSFGCQLM
ncbi:leucine-rich repeat domain-containing protein [Legionella gresilensis]|uniref:leucine-rich repeat domain-containing protein n=1 Tax=Legionella gresilensis TaxID=91823 RepID=UPI00104122A1|nr:leucine-rich repeat domain-containing protein [Legionella gresilensis]